jgi:prepilin-type N-terminal cleavage/methylation domain-containing protein
MRTSMTSDSRGFTLLEVLVALAISAGVSMAGWSFHRQQVRDLTHQSGKLDATEAIRASSAFIAREIRMAGYDPTTNALSAAGATGIVEAGAQVLHLESDKNGDGMLDVAAVDPVAESILYTYDAASQRILRTVGGMSQIVARRVPQGAFSFAYFDIDRNPLPMEGSPPSLSASSRDAVALVQIRVGARSGSGPSAPTLEIASGAAIRARILERL